MHLNPYNGYFKIHLIGESVKVVVIKFYLLINLAIQCVWFDTTGPRIHRESDHFVRRQKRKYQVTVQSDGLTLF